MRITRLVAALALSGPWLCGAASAADTLKATIDRLGGQPCRVGALTCVSVEVPVDYRANTGPKIKIEYAISFASGQSKGVLFYVVGGPGGSGIGVADDYLSAFDVRLTENMDIVFFDQRGVGLYLEEVVAEMLGDDRGGLERAARRRRPEIDVGRRAERPPQRAVVNVAIVERGLESDVARGENAGRTLRQDNVVRAFASVGLDAPSGRLELAVPSDLDPGQASVVGYVQRHGNKAIVGATAVEVPVAPGI